MNKITDVMIKMIRAEVCGAAYEPSELPSLSEEELISLYKLSKEHDLCHIVGSALEKNKLLPDGAQVSEAFRRKLFEAVWRYERMKFQLEKLCDIFEEGEICHIPLKGAAVRRLYPEPWMRTSCDIDILIFEKDISRAADVLVKNGYKMGEKTSHDLSFFSDGGVHLELHYDLVEDGLVADSAKVLQNVWESCAAREGRKYQLEMPDELFYFYHIAHMAKHLKNGGCGVRPLLDDWVLRHRAEYDEALRAVLLAEGGLAVFAESAKRLSEVWFSGCEPDETTFKMQNYILEGGIYGNDTNRIAVKKVKHGGKLGYLMSRLFVPYNELKCSYPVLEVHRWLMPVMQVRRWSGALFGKKARRAMREMRALNASDTDGIAEFLMEIGL